MTPPLVEEDSPRPDVVPDRPARPTTGTSVANALAPLLGALFADRLPVRIEFWDASAAGPMNGPGTVRVGSPDALNRLLWSPGELGMARAFVTGELDLDGDIFAVLRSLPRAAPADLKLGARFPMLALKAARRLGALRLPLPRPGEEALPRGRRHSKSRDADVIQHHYDIGNDFYRLMLGPSMTYSCGRFPTPATGLEEAQALEARVWSAVNSA